MHVKKVTGITKDFMRGADVSSYLSQEKSGVIYYDEHGNPGNHFEILKKAGFNYVRIRIWNDPFDEDGNGYGAGNCDLACAIEIGKRATAAGLRTKIAFHYSDFWADPGKQMSPKAWIGMDIANRAQALYEYTYESVTALLEAGVDVGIVAVGNENNATSDGAGMAGVDGRWDTPEQAANLLKLFKAGTEATRNAAKHCGKADLKIAVHIADPYQNENYLNFAARLSEAKIDYDIYGSSYYPFWHGTQENLTDILTQVSQKYDIDVFCVELSYPTTIDDGDGFEVYKIKYGEKYQYAISPQGQANAIRDVSQAIANVPGGRGLGVFLWEPTWIPVGPPSNWEQNFALWEAHGSGWAASYGASYNPQIAGRYGGTGWDNKSVFDFNGHPLPSITVFKDIYEGREPEGGIVIDVVEDAEVEVEYFEGLTIEAIMAALPCTALAIYSDNTHKDLPVSWDMVPIMDALAQMEAKPHVRYLELTGITADDGRAHCTLLIAPKNLVQNPSFEAEDMGMWKTVYIAGENYASRHTRSPKLGENSFGFSRPVPLAAHFTLEQDIVIENTGTYTFEASVTGDYAKENAENEFYAYVNINGELVKKEAFDLPGYRGFNVPKISGIEARAGDIVTIGFAFKASKGISGAIDDVFFY